MESTLAYLPRIVKVMCRSTRSFCLSLSYQLAS